MKKTKRNYNNKNNDNKNNNKMSIKLLFNLYFFILI